MVKSWENVGIDYPDDVGDQKPPTVLLSVGN